MVVMGDFFGGSAGVDESCCLWGRVRVSTGVFHERFRAMVCGASGASIRLAICASAVVVSPAGVPRDAVGCARVGVYGCRGLARGRPPRDFWVVSLYLAIGKSTLGMLTKIRTD